MKLTILLSNSQNKYTTWIDMQKNSTITRLQGKSNPTNLIENEHWMKEIQTSKVAAIKIQFGALSQNVKLIL